MLNKHLKYSNLVKESMQQSYYYRFNDVPTLEIMNDRKKGMTSHDIDLYCSTAHVLNIM